MCRGLRVFGLEDDNGACSVPSSLSSLSSLSSSLSLSVQEEVLGVFWLCRSVGNLLVECTFLAAKNLTVWSEELGFLGSGCILLL